MNSIALVSTQSGGISLPASDLAPTSSSGGGGGSSKVGAIVGGIVGGIAAGFLLLLRELMSHFHPKDSLFIVGQSLSTCVKERMLSSSLAFSNVKQ